MTLMTAAKHAAAPLCCPPPLSPPQQRHRNPPRPILSQSICLRPLLCSTHFQVKNLRRELLWICVDGAIRRGQVCPMKRQRVSHLGEDGASRSLQPHRPDSLHYASDLMVGFKYMKTVTPDLDEDGLAQLRMVHDSCSERVELHDACREQSINPSDKMRSNVTASTKKLLQDVANKYKKLGAEYVSAWNTGTGESQIANSLGKDIDKEVIRLIRGGKPHSVSLFREDGCLGVKATKDIRKDMPILVDCGTLTEVQMFENMHNQDSMAHVVSTSVPSTLMQELGYTGPELMIETTQFANETRFLNDNFWAYSPYEMDANAGFFLIFDCLTAQPHIVLFALENIRKNHEIVISWGNEMWATICTKHVTAQAETSQWWALWSDALLRTCRANNIAVPPMKRERPLTTQLFFDANRRNHYGIYEYVMSGMVRQPSLGGALPLLQRLRAVDKGSRHELMKVVPVHQAMKRSNCKFIDYVDASFLDKSIQQELKSCHKKKQDRLYPDLVRLMEGGAPKVRVVEILDRSNPARFYTPPHITTFGVVAATKFRKGEYILCYWGRLRVAEDYATDSVGAESEWYTFTINSEQIPGYTGPQLVVENLTTGNEARFVNDKWQHPNGEANVEALITWDDEKKVPVVGFLALCTIEEGEELLIDYGPDFWKTMYCGIMRAHTETYRQMMPWCQRMKQLIEENHVDEPPKPDFSRSLPPLVMETMDICNEVTESHDEKFRRFDDTSDDEDDAPADEAAEQEGAAAPDDSRE